MCCARVAVIKDIHIRKFYERVKRRRGEKKATLAVA
jgi:ribosomal protein S21